jgi:N-acetylglucosamine-6-sulfatase
MTRGGTVAGVATWDAMMRTRSRRAVLALALVALSASACTATDTVKGKPHTSLVAQARASSARPNIVFVLTDDLSLNLIRHMPHVQALQRDGTTMSNYYVVDSLCCPSRSAIFTGEYPHNNGVFTNHGSDGGYHTFKRRGDEQKSFAVTLHAAGYRTGFMGKYLNEYQPRDPAPPGWDEWDATGNGYPEFDYVLNEDDTQHRYGHKPGDYLTDVVSKKAGTFIDSAAAHKQPFMLEVATFAPHTPYVAAPRYDTVDKGLRYPRTAGFDKIPTDPPSWLKGRPPLTARQQQRIDNVYRKRVRADLAVDDLIAHLQDRLRTDRIAGNTYFVFSSDNGYHMGENRLMPGKQTAFDTDVHVPLVVSGPGVPAGATAPQMASNIDLGPTFVSLTGTPVPSTADGVSLTPVLHGRPPAAWQQAVLVEHHGPNSAKDDPDRANPLTGNPPTYSAVRTAHALYVRYANGEQEYYDTARDPLELHNIAERGVPAGLNTTLAALRTCRGAAACQAAARLR